MKLASLSVSELRELARDVEHEVSLAARSGAPHGDLSRFLGLIESKIDRLADDGLPPTLQRRQQLYAATGSKLPGMTRRL